MTRSRATLAIFVVAATLMLMGGPAAAQDPAVSVDPSTDLADGDTVTVTVSGFPANGDSFVSGQCVTPITNPLEQCNVANIVPVPLDGSGAATFDLVVGTGPIGSGSCGFGGDDCVIMVGSLAEPEFGVASITFSETELAVTGLLNLVNFLTLASLLLIAGALMVQRSRRIDTMTA